MSFAPPAKRDESGELVYDIDRSHSRIEPKFAAAKSPGRGLTPFRRIKKRTLVRQIGEESLHEENALDILRELEKLGAKSMDWTAFSPTQYGTMKRDSAGSPHSVLHTVFTGGQWQRSRTSSPAVQKRSHRNVQEGLARRSPSLQISVASNFRSRSVSPAVASPSSKLKKSPKSPQAAFPESPGESMGVGNISAIGGRSSPSYMPTRSPSYMPTRSPSYMPTRSPSYMPTRSPSVVSFQPDLPYLQSPSSKKRSSIASPLPTGSKYEYSVEVQLEDGSKAAERQPFGKEKAEVKDKFHHTRVFALRRKYQRLLKGDDNLFHRHVSKAIKGLEKECQPLPEDKEDFEQAAKLNLVRLSCRLLGTLFVGAKSKQDEEKVERCNVRYGLTRALTNLHVYATNLRYRMMMVMIYTLRRHGRKAVEGLVQCVVRAARSRRALHQGSSTFLCGRLRKAVRVLLRGSAAKKVRRQREERTWLAMHLRRESQALRRWWSYSKERLNKRCRDNQLRQLARVRYLKSTAHYCGLNNFREWIAHVAKTSPVRSRAHNRLVLLFDGLFALRQWRDSHPAFQHAQRSHRAMALKKSLRRLNRWQAERLHRHRGMRNAFWTSLRTSAKKRLGYWKAAVSGAHTHHFAMGLGWSCFRSKRLKFAIKQWNRRVQSRKNYHLGRKTVGVAFQKVVSKRTGGSTMLDGRAVLHGALRLWTEFMFARVADRDRNLRDGMLVLRRNLRIFFTLFKKLTLFKKRWADSGSYHLAHHPTRGPNRLMKLRSMHALFYRLLVGREKKSDPRETYYSDKSVKKAFREWRRYYHRLDVLTVTLYRTGGRLFAEKAWEAYTSAYSLMMQRKVILHNMRRAADHQRLKHLGGIVMLGLKINHEELRLELVMANQHYLRRYMIKGFRNARTFQLLRKHSKRALKAVRQCHFSYFLARWSFYIKLRRRRERIVNYSRNPRRVRLLMEPCNVMRWHFSTWLRWKRMRRKLKQRKSVAVTRMETKWRTEVYFDHLMDFAMRSMKFKRHKSHAREERREHHLRRCLLHVKERCIRKHREFDVDTGKRVRNLRRLDQERAGSKGDRALYKRRKRMMLTKWLEVHEHMWRRRTLLRAGLTRRRQKMMTRGMSVFRHNIHLLHAAHETHKIRLRRWIEKWRQKQEHVSIWHNAGKSILFRNTGFMLNRAFREWRADTHVERELEEHLLTTGDGKCKHALEAFRLFWRRTHKARTQLRAADDFHKGLLFDAIVVELRSDVRQRKVRLQYMAEIDKHYTTVRKKQVVQALITMQINRVGYRFRRLHQIDEMLFAFKASTNRARYTKMLFQIADDAAKRRLWLSFRRQVKRSKLKGKKAEAQARELDKPMLSGYYISDDAAFKSRQRCNAFHRTLLTQQAVTMWFRYVTYCVKKERREAVDTDEFRRLYCLRRVVLCLKTHRHKRLYSRHVHHVTARIQRDFAARRVVSKLTLGSFGKWAELQKHRITGEKMMKAQKARGLRKMQVVPDLQ